MTAISNFDWVEICDPRTRVPMFVHLESGDCVELLPDGSRVKQLDRNQWWEFYDTGTGRYYYYNYMTEATLWQKPPYADIIPLAKIQSSRLQQQQQQQPHSRHSSRHSSSLNSGTQTPVLSDQRSNQTAVHRQHSLAIGSTSSSESNRIGNKNCSTSKTPTQSRRRERASTVSSSAAAATAAVLESCNEYSIGLPVSASSNTNNTASFSPGCVQVRCFD
ncbi:hypothetical protein BOX15_Mlig032710g1 [Macrostomum lignano]|uniref:WW domain-containing protein n=1 Tax=Macrostomum lignano TaxID=282301 RepID=A0A267H0H9_9PLAT|nr:hypothetical protein BOX15_Mlig032710g1 [Macrostomum lignano]